jgi:excisionase family DNA binding protein
MSALPRTKTADTMPHSEPPGVLPRELVDLPPTLTVERVAKLLGVGRNAAYEAVASGQLPALRVGRRWVVPTIPFLRLLGVSVASETALKTEGGR